METKNKKLIAFIIAITLLGEAFCIFGLYKESTIIIKAFDEGFSSAFQFIVDFLMLGFTVLCIMEILKGAIETIKYLIDTDEERNYKYYEEDKGFPLMTPTFFADGEADNPKNQEE